MRVWRTRIRKPTSPEGWPHLSQVFLLGIWAALLGSPIASTRAAGESRSPVLSQPFVHPGLLHPQTDLERMKEKVAQGAQPWASGFERLKRHRQSQADWSVRGPFASVVRDPLRSQHLDELAADSNAAYQNALMWCVTGNEAHARKSVEILNAWSSTLREIAGRDKELGSSLCGFKLVNAAELMRHAYHGWQPPDMARCGQMLTNVFYPAIKDFAPFANGNWGSGCIKTIMAIGVFCDDPQVFNRAVEYYEHGSGNGSLTHYIINETGQCQESGRDQQHAQLGLAHLAEACEIGWQQGLDLYGAADNRLLRGFEYTAQYNLGGEVPFVTYRDTTGKYAWKAISPQGRSRMRPIFEMVWNHYENRRGLKAPFTRQAAEKTRPEGAAWQADHPGFGTLLFTRP
jgi:hypothetical protein